MRRLLVAAVILFAAGAVSAQVTITPGPAWGDPNNAEVLKQQGNLDSAKRLTREEAMKLVKENKAVFIDVRSKESYDSGHIKGALSFPNSQLLARMRELPLGKTLITYCACEKEHTAAVAVLNLAGRGHKNAAALIGGWYEWSALGLPTEKTVSR